MVRISSIVIEQQPEHYMVTKRATIDFMEEYSDFVGQSLKSIQKYLNSSDVLPSSCPVVCFHNIDLKSLDVEVGFEVPVLLSHHNEFNIFTVPMRKVVSAIDLGPYEQQDPTLEELMNWFSVNNVSPSGEIYYYYLNDTERSDSEFLTKMVMPIK